MLMLSRLRFRQKAPSDNGETMRVSEVINAVYFASDLLDPNSVRHEFATSRLVQQIFLRVKSGNWTRCSQDELPFKMQCNRLTIQNGLLYVGTRLFIPPRLRWKAFQIAHGAGHSGIGSTLSRLQISAWWPGMAGDVALMVSDCSVCCGLRLKSAKTVNLWPSPKQAFERVHMDWAHIKNIGDLLIVVDAVSGCIEAFRCVDRTTDAVINCLRTSTVFTRFGIPEVVVSDNAPEFVSTQLNQWLANQGAREMESPIYFPKANGAAERAVQTVKTALRCWKLEKSASAIPQLSTKGVISSSQFGILSKWKVSRRDCVRPTVAHANCVSFPHG